ncbi:MAG: exodeoxyribonuclease V subunit gamma [Myxococcota bacterium]|jgi:exodeoxyribonuclease V gamma subunit|nr:exodeoxyribonuclease V subunit gamma [Myxococcota bacterium]
MIIHRSNRAEALIEALAKVVAVPRSGVFDPELLVVQGQGMERWIAMELAQRLGVWANQRVLTLRDFVDDIALRMFDREVDPVYDTESMLWSIAELLYELEGRPEFGSIAGYLEDDADGRRRIQLAHQISNTFYRYMGYREEMLHAWLDPARASAHAPADEPDVAWQATLWRQLVARHGDGHLAGRGRALIDRLVRGNVEAGRLPERLSVFGVSSLPRLHFDLIRALGRHCELHLFMLSPTPHYWGDVATEREARRSLHREGSSVDLEGGVDLDEELHLDVGHPLLSTYGKLGRDFHSMLVASGDLDEGEGDLHSEPVGEGLLSGLQSDVYTLQASGRSGLERRSFDSGDRSLRIHACHSPMREVEVLCEELVACFEADASLEPQDVVVMTPDIKTYAPYIEAVFGVRARGAEAAARGEGAIPYRISDRWPDPTDEVVDAFFAGLEVVAGRFSAPDVLDLLGRPCVAQHFGLGTEDLARVEAWIGGAGIRWGIDAAHRAEQAQPEIDVNTWRFGIDRLLLGVAIEGADDALFEGVQPFGDAEGQRAETLERLLEVHRFLVASRATLSGMNSPHAWREALLCFLEGLAIDDDDHHDQHLMLRKAIVKTAEQATNVGFERAVSLTSLREQLERQLQHARRSTGFLAGGVTFCELVPMRSIPFRVVCLLGMNDGAFPRIDHPPGFDLMARDPKLGDRTMRDDDRYLFLEALLSARDRLVITYVGQSIRDGAELPPSAAVSELVDVICDAHAIDQEGEPLSHRAMRKRIREQIEIRHPLHPYGARYQDELRRVFPVHRQLHRELARIDTSRVAREGAFSVRVDPGAEESAIASLALEDLVAFFHAPSRAFVRDTLGIVLRDEREPIARREAFSLDPREAANVGQLILDLHAAGVGFEDAFEVVDATGVLPHGSAGRLAFEDLVQDAEQIARWNTELNVSEAMPKQPFTIQCGGVDITGHFDAIGEAGQVFSSFQRLGRGSELRAWLRHLVWQVGRARDPAAFGKTPPQTSLVGRAQSGKQHVYAIRFGPCEDAEGRLAALVDLYREGLKAPLPLFHEASRAYASALAKKGEAGAIDAARKKFAVDAWSGFGDESDPYVELAFRGVDPFDADANLACGVSFAAAASEVYEPLLAAREELG